MQAIATIEPLVVHNTATTQPALAARAIACRHGECMLGQLISQIQRNSFLCQSQLWQIVDKFNIGVGSKQQLSWRYTDVGVGSYATPVVALREAGTLRSDVKTGILTKANIQELLPWNNYLTVIRINGSTMQKLLE